MSHKSFTWAVIGAGPAGIATVGKLIDLGVAPQKVAWIDPSFTIGDFGRQWRHVSSNTRVELFLKFLNGCTSFQYASAPNFHINSIDPTDTCQLGIAAEPLQWVTHQLTKKVNAISDKVQHLELYDRHWRLTLSDHKIHAEYVVMAIGGEPKSLSFPGTVEVPLNVALSPNKLKVFCEKDDIIAVFGSSHSAILILKNLFEVCDVNRVINFYRSPLCYAVHMDNWILFDDTGLKGSAAEWARANIDGKPPEKLQRILSNQESILTHLPECTKVIYATGFQKRLIPVEGMQTLEYNDRNGIIAPGLFGVGIAFPEAKLDQFGTLAYRVGLWKFMDYLNNVMPVWMKYGA